MPAHLAQTRPVNLHLAQILKLTTSCSSLLAVYIQEHSIKNIKYEQGAVRQSEA